MNIVVEIGYRRFYFEDVDKAIEFAQTAKATCSDKDEDVKVEITFINEEGSDEV